MFGDANDFESVRLLRDVVCSLGGETTFVRNLDQAKLPVLAIESEHGFGVHMEAQLSLLGSENISRIFQPGFGHADAYLSSDHEEWVEKPIAAWLDRQTQPSH